MKKYIVFVLLVFIVGCSNGESRAKTITDRGYEVLLQQNPRSKWHCNDNDTIIGTKEEKIFIFQM